MNSIINHILVYSVCALILFCSERVYAQQSENGNILIERFDKVDANLFRGAQPTEVDLLALKKMGIKKIVNLRQEQDVNKNEKAWVEKLGMQYINIPWAIYGPYDQQVFTRFFDVIQDKDVNPVFFHCKRGSERTGVIAAAYKIKKQGMSYEDALADTEHYDIKLIWRPFVRMKIIKFVEESSR